MIYEIEVTKQAQADLEGIYEYIAFTLLAPENAEGQLDRIEKSILKLEHMPFRFRKYDTEPWRSKGVRIMPVDNYVVLYFPDGAKRIVTIIRVMYGGRDISKELREEYKA